MTDKIDATKLHTRLDMETGICTTPCLMIVCQTGDPEAPIRYHGFGGDGTSMNGNIVLGGAGDDVIKGGIGNDCFSGGAGTKEHFYDAVVKGGVDGLLAASLFHFKELEIPELKEYLKSKGVPVRMEKNERNC